MTRGEWNIPFRSNYKGEKDETSFSKVEIMNERKKLKEHARECSEKYLSKYAGCAQATFAAIADTLDLKGRDQVFEAVIGFSGGGGALGGGSCGALAGAVAAISLSYKLSREELEKNKNRRKTIYYDVGKVMRKFRKKYEGVTCTEVQKELYDETFDLWDEKEYEEFQKISECGKVVADITAWAVEVILQSRSSKN